MKQHSKRTRSKSCTSAPDTNSLFTQAFRPFFLTGAIASIVLMIVWIFTISGKWGLSGYFDYSIWHAHEMIFGFIAAIIVGFLHTAIQSWTGLRGIHGTVLLSLFVLWLAARILLLLPTTQFAIVTTLVDLSFIPAATVLLARILIKAKQLRNAVFIPILTLFFVANLLMHLQALGIADTATTGTRLAMWTILMLIITIGGRVVPFFMQRAIPDLNAVRNKWLETASVVSFILLAGSDLLGFNTALHWLAGICVLFHALRQYGWRPLRSVHEPLLWVLHVGYAWLITGFILIGLTESFYIPRSLAMHAFFVGAMGNFIIGIMSRVSLGHTGLPIRASKFTIAAFILINIAAFSRSIIPLVSQQNWLTAIITAGIVWVVAYSMFLAAYYGILTGTRLNGKTD